MKAESQPTEQQKPSAESVGDDHLETPMGGRGRALLRLAVIALVIWSVDQLVKWQSFEKVAGDPVDIHSHGVNGMSAIPWHDATTLVPKVLAFKLVLNEGAVFGIGQGGRWMFVAISIIALIVIAEVFRRSRPGDVLLHFGLASVLAGALGNLYDRVVYGVVRDMLYLFPDVHLPFGWTWPTGDSDLYPWIFNIADVALLVGLVALFIHMFRAERAARKQGDADDAAAPPSS